MHTGRFLSLIATVVLPCFAFAGAGITYHGKLLDPSGHPVTASSVQFRIQIRTPGNENCLMYQETQAVNMSSSDGIFAVTINDGTATVVNTEPFSLDRVFQNRGTFSFAGGKCALGSSYAPNPTDGRKIAVEFNDGSGWEPLPAQTINFVPMAMESMTLGGFGSANFLRVVDGSGNPVSLSPWTSANYTALTDLIAGSSASYLNPSSALNGANLGAGSVTDAKVASGISGSKISGNISGNAAGFTGSLSGDVTGTQGATVVSKIQGRAVDTAPPSNGQVLKWNQSASRWEAANETGGGGSVTSVTGTGGVQITGTSTDPIVGVQDASTSQKGVVQLATSGQNAAGVVVQGNDSRLSDARTPTAHTHAVDEITSASAKYFGYKPNNVACASNEILKWDSANSRWICGTDLGLTSVTASGPLASSGGATPNITITKADTSTNGYLSSTDWNTFNGKQNALGFTPVNKAGDTMSGALTVPANGLTVGTNQLVASGGSIGIGTASPGTTLDVAGMARFGWVANPTSGAGLEIKYKSTNNTGFITAYDRTASAYKDLQIDGNTIALNAGSGGNVGIGTTAPNALLDVNGTMRVTQICDSAGANCKTVSSGWGSGGSVTSVSGTGGLTGTVTTSGSLSLANIANNNLLANTSGSAGTPVATTLSGLIDSALTGSAQGNILYRGASGWAVLAPGTSGRFLKTQGAGTDPVWAAAGAGTVTSVDLTVPSIMSVSGGPVTSSGTLAVSLASQGANTVFAGPTSGSAAPTFRALNISDVRSTVANGNFLTGGACTSGQALVYNSPADTISCATISLTSSQVTTALTYTPVNKAGDTMTGALTVPANGLTVGTTDLVVTGSKVGIGTATPGQKLSVAGTIESTTGGIKFPDGSVQTTAANMSCATRYNSCAAIKAANSSSSSGVYTIDPDGSGGTAAFSVYCDMSTDGGGWTLLSTAVDGNYFTSQAEIDSFDAANPSPSSNKYSILARTDTIAGGGNGTTRKYLYVDRRTNGNRWVEVSQTNSLFTSSITGYSLIAYSNAPTSLLNGFGLSTNGNSWYDGNISNWQFAVGQRTAYSSSGTVGGSYSDGATYSDAVSVGYAFYVKPASNSSYNDCSVSSSQWTTNGADVYYTANVGIGTTAPTAKLEVNGTLKVGGNETSGTAADDIKAYIQKTMCENRRGVWVDGSGCTEFAFYLSSPCQFGSCTCPAGSHMCSFPDLFTGGFQSLRRPGYDISAVAGVPYMWIAGTYGANKDSFFYPWGQGGSTLQCSAGAHYMMSMVRNSSGDTAWGCYQDSYTNATAACCRNTN